MADTHSVPEKMCLSEPTTKVRMKIYPYYQWQKCRPMTLVSGGIKFIRIFAEVPQGGPSSDGGVVDNGIFLAFLLAIFRTL